MSCIYLIQTPTTRRLVNASTPAQAIRYAVGMDYSATVATQTDLVSMRTVDVEDATKTADAS